jgi:hypothetical protein
MPSTCIQRDFPEIHLHRTLLPSFVYPQPHKNQNVIPDMAVCRATIDTSPLWRIIVFRNVDRFESSVCWLARTTDMLVPLGAIPVGCMYVVFGAFAMQSCKNAPSIFAMLVYVSPWITQSQKYVLIIFYINPSDAAHELPRVIATGSSGLSSTRCSKKSEINICSHCQKRKINISDFSTITFVCCHGNRWQINKSIKRFDEFY